MNDFHPYAQNSKYVQDYENACCIISLASTLLDSREYTAEQAVVLWLKLSLIFESFGYKNGIQFTDYIIIDNARNESEQSRRYELVQWKKTRIWYFYGISDHVTFVQIMGTSGNVNH